MSKKPDLLTAIRESPGIHSMVYNDLNGNQVLWYWHFALLCGIFKFFLLVVRSDKMLSNFVVFVWFFFVWWVSNIQCSITFNFLKSCFRALSVKSWMSCQPSASTTAFYSPTCWPFTPGLRKKTKEQRSLSTPNAGVTTNEILSSLFCSPFSPSS